MQTHGQHPTPPSCAYFHTQVGPIAWILGLVAAAFFGLALFAHQADRPFFGLVALGALLLGLAPCFHRLTVRDDGDQLTVRFGPIPLFGTKIKYADITRVEPGRLDWLDGGGIHYVPGRGWVYNLWGPDCVHIFKDRPRPIRVGSDDLKGLLEFLKRKVDP